MGGSLGRGGSAFGRDGVKRGGWTDWEIRHMCAVHRVNVLNTLAATSIVCSHRIRSRQTACFQDEGTGLSRENVKYSDSGHGSVD